MSVLRKPQESWTAADSATQQRVGGMPGDASWTKPIPTPPLAVRRNPQQRGP